MVKRIAVKPTLVLFHAIFLAWGKFLDRNRWFDKYELQIYDKMPNNRE